MSQFDQYGREKALCRVCGKYFHRVDVHLAKKHKEITLSEYKKKYPGFPLLSKAAAQAAGGELENTPDQASDDGLQRIGPAELRIRLDEELDDFDRSFVPAHDEGWVLDAKNLTLLAVGVQDNDNILITGPPGVGKTSIVKELAAILNQPLRRLPFSGEMRLSSLIGKDSLKASDSGVVTDYQLGPLPLAATRGHWCLLDEFDAAPPEVTFVLHSVMETRNRHLALMDADGGKEVEFNENFRIIATGNTLGLGDETGLYAGTTPMNEALLDRFGTVIAMDYPSPDEESERVMARVPGAIKADVEKMILVAGAVRKDWREGSAMVSLSPRRVESWASKAVRLGSIQQAAEVSIINKLPSQDAQAVRGLVQRYFGGAV